MTPAARVAAAIEIIDRALNGDAAEKVLTNWARGNRYAGSGDRAAIRDLVFDALRRRRSYGYLGGSDTGRGLMIGALRAAGTPLDTIFSGQKYAPDPLQAEETETRDLAEASRAVRLDIQDWMLPLLGKALAEETDKVLGLLRQRAPVFLRVNLAKVSRQEAIAQLRLDDIVARPHPLAETALEIAENPRRISRSACYLSGAVELQDAASQAVVEMLPVQASDSVLDYCAGGGGKSLALAGQGVWDLTAHDADPNRMANLMERAARAGARIDIAARNDLSGRRFDLVLCDIPCSGSGAWRRSPDAKWRLQPADLSDLARLQDEILSNAQQHTRPGGHLALVTCSLFREENEELVARFCARHSHWGLLSQSRLSPLQGGDGFFWLS